LRNSNPDMSVTQTIAKRIMNLVGLCRLAFYYGYIPLVMVLGYMQGSEPGHPPVTLLSIISPISDAAPPPM
ncbi:hypothetical protein BOX15_Mlig029932g2, partial [Macrostomum lignano]